jgi:prepilin-type N-terminal cleavage/methylation domain-containing protein
MRTRGGFTVFELLVVLVLAGIVAGTALPRVSRALAENRLQRAASVVVADLQLAHSMAARQRRPVRVEVDPTTRQIRVLNMASPDTTYSARHLGPQSEFGLQHVTSSRPVLTVYPSGLANDTLQVTLRAGASVRRVRMTRAGQIRVEAS